MLNNLVNDFEVELDDVGTIAELSNALVPQLGALAVLARRAAVFRPVSPLK